MKNFRYWATESNGRNHKSLLSSCSHPFLPWLRDPTLSVWFARNVWKFLSWNFIHYWIKWRTSVEDVNMSFGHFRNESRRRWWGRIRRKNMMKMMMRIEWVDAWDENGMIMMLVIRGSEERNKMRDLYTK